MMRLNKLHVRPNLPGILSKEVWSSGAMSSYRASYFCQELVKTKTELKQIHL